MTDNNYAFWLSLLGKLCYSYDQSNAAIPTLNEGLFRTSEQVTQSGNDPSRLAELVLVSTYNARWQNVIAQGPAPLASLMVQLGQALITTPDFTSQIITSDGIAALAAGSKTSPLICAQALAAELGDDSKTLQTASGAGLVNFINAIAGQDVSLPQSGSPSFSDADFVTLTIL